MKRSTILIVILLCSALSSSAQEIDKLPVITVSGTAEVRTHYEKRELNLRIRTI